jgi:hypothetical protein
VLLAVGYAASRAAGGAAVCAPELTLWHWLRARKAKRQSSAAEVGPEDATTYPKEEAAVR